MDFFLNDILPKKKTSGIEWENGVKKVGRGETSQSKRTHWDRADKVGQIENTQDGKNKSNCQQ